MHTLYFLFILISLTLLPAYQTSDEVDDLLVEAITSDAGLNSVFEENQGLYLSEVENVEQFTVEIQWGYADAQRVVFGIVVQADDSQNYTNLHFANAELTLSNGQVIPFESASAFFPGVEDNRGAILMEADVGDSDLHETLEGLLVLRIAYATEAHRATVPPPQSGPSSTDFEEWLLKSSLVTFDIELSILEGYEVKPNIEIVSEDMPITLQSFKVSPSLGTAVFCFVPPVKPEEERWEWSIDTTLRYEDDTLVGVSSGRNIDGCAIVIFRSMMPQEPVTWDISVDQIRGVRTNLPEESELRATVEALGGEIGDDMNSITLPPGGLEAAGWVEEVEGEWRFIFDSIE